MIVADYYVPLKEIQDTAYKSKDIQKTERFYPDDVNVIFADVEQTRINAVAQDLSKIFNLAAGQGLTPTGQAIGTFTITTPKSFEKQISSFFLLSEKLLLMILSTIITGAILIIIFSLNHNVIERTKEFGILRAVGYTNINIQKIIVTETFILLLIGYLIGLLASLAAIYFLSLLRVNITIPWELNPFPHFLLSDPSRADTILSYPLPVAFQLPQALVSAVISAAAGLLTIMVTLRTINKFKVMEVLRHE
jgi:putative ABC transport system permease protein